METLLVELRQRWDNMFAALRAGGDLPPSVRLRAEGLMEAALLTGAATREELDSAMASCYLQAFGRAIEADFGSAWREFYPFPQIPAVCLRAPVYPSTRD